MLYILQTWRRNSRPSKGLEVLYTPYSVIKTIPDTCAAVDVPGAKTLVAAIADARKAAILQALQHLLGAPNWSERACIIIHTLYLLPYPKPNPNQIRSWSERARALKPHATRHTQQTGVPELSALRALSIEANGMVFLMDGQGELWRAIAGKSQTS
ncbi:hypothetical protein T492DRAFT_834759 [Pavlovales sp. CCMP2436]|nr:hypothetical protein T492DRAFT_834759 [Pavlovales sp. CCMP2436]